MLSAIKELANRNEEEKEEHMATLYYLRACNLLFEEGILSKTPISSASSPLLTNMNDGFTYFMQWKEDIANLKGGKHLYPYVSLLFISFFPAKYSFRNPNQKSYLAWQASLINHPSHCFSIPCITPYRHMTFYYLCTMALLVFVSIS